VSRRRDPRTAGPFCSCTSSHMIPLAFEAVAAELAAAGARALFPTCAVSADSIRVRIDATFRSAGCDRPDVLNLVETLALEAPILVGYDWGSRAACVLPVLRASAAAEGEPRLVAVLLPWRAWAARSHPLPPGTGGPGVAPSGPRRVQYPTRTASGRPLRSITPASSMSFLLLPPPLRACARRRRARG
jgi:hypothetical protein